MWNRSQKRGRLGTDNKEIHQFRGGEVAGTDGVDESRPVHGETPSISASGGGLLLQNAAELCGAWSSLEEQDGHLAF